MANALTAHAVAAATAHRGPARACRPAAAVLFAWVVVALGALTVRPQATRVAHTHAALEGAIAVVALGAVDLRLRLALAVALEGDGDGERIFKAYWLDDKCLFLLFGATTGSRLHAESHLKEKKKVCELCEFHPHHGGGGHYTKPL